MEAIEWRPERMLEVKLKEPDDFLKVRETLSRIGVASRKERKLYQSCHILHKQGRYYIVHFKELFALDGKDTNISENDVARRNSIAVLLGDWGLIEIIGDTEPKAPLSQIKVISFKEKSEWDWRQNITLEKSENYKMSKDILNALRQVAQAKIDMHKVNVMVYLKNPAGIGEHSDIAQTVEKELQAMAQQQDVIDMIDNYFPEDQLPLFS